MALAVTLVYIFLLLCIDKMCLLSHVIWDFAQICLIHILGLASGRFIIVYKRSDASLRNNYFDSQVSYHRHTRSA